MLVTDDGSGLGLGADLGLGAGLSLDADLGFSSVLALLLSFGFIGVIRLAEDRMAEICGLAGHFKRIRRVFCREWGSGSPLS